MADTPSRSAKSQLGIAASNPVNAAFEFISCGLKMREVQTNSEGIRGTRSRLSHRTRITRREISGPIVMNPTALELDKLWGWMLGGTIPGTSPWSVGDVMNEMFITVDKVAKVFTYAGCIAARWSLSGASGQPIRLTIDVEGETETMANAGTFPSLAIPTDNFFVFSDLTATIGGTARKFGSFNLSCDNLVDPDRYLNALTRTEIAGMDRMVQLQLGTPYTTDNTDLVQAAIAGAAASIVLTDGSSTYTFAIANAKIPSVGPDVEGKQEIQSPISVMCYNDGTDPELKVTKS